MVESPRETIHTPLNALKRKKVLEMRGRTLIEKNREELERLAQAQPNFVSERVLVTRVTDQAGSILE
jgi:hypothetical protein